MVKAKHKTGCPQRYESTDECMCDFIKPKKRQRKPYRKVVVKDKNVQRGIREDLILEVHPNGRLVIREKGRKLRVETTLGVVYERLLVGRNGR